MSIRQVSVWVAVCDGCGRELGQGYGHREIYDTQQEAEQAARAAGWTRHPNGNLYCKEGQHQ